MELDLVCFLVAFWSERALLGLRGILLYCTRKNVLSVGSSGAYFLEHENGGMSAEQVVISFLALFPAFLGLVDCLNTGIALRGEAWDIIGPKKSIGREN